MKLKRSIGNRKKLFIIGTTIGAIVAAIIIISSALAIPQDHVSLAPSFAIVDTRGTVLSLSDLRGRVVVVDFMATWCAPCKEEMEHLVKIYDKYGEKITILSISTSPDFDTDDMLNQFMAENNAKWKAGRGTSDLVRDYEVFLIPKLVIIDREGYIRFENIGVTNDQIISKELDKIL